MNKVKIIQINKIKVIFICLCIFNLYSLSSCQRNISVENRDFVDTIGVDFVDDEIKVTLLIPDPTKVAEGESEVNQVVTGSAESFTQAIKNADYKSANKLSLENARVILLGNDLAKNKKKLDLIFDTIKRNNVISKRVIIAISENTAESILVEKIDNVTIFGQYLVDYYNQSPQEIFNSYDKKLSKLISKINLIHNAIVPIISIDEDKKLSLDKGVLFSYGDYIDTFDNDILRGYALLNNQTNNIVVEVEYNEEKIPVTIKSRKSKIKFNENGDRILVEVIQDYDCLLTEFYGEVSNKDIENLRDIFNEKIESDIYNSLDYFINQNNSDIYGFEDRLKKDNYDLYEKYTNDTDDYKNGSKTGFIDKLDFDVVVNSKIISTGSIK